MKIQSAEKKTVNYPLKKELTPLLLGLALSVSGYAAEVSDANDTEMEIFKGMVLGQQVGVSYTNGKFDINDTTPPCKTALPSPSFEGVLIAGEVPGSSQVYTVGEEFNRSNEMFSPDYTDIQILYTYQFVKGTNMESIPSGYFRRPVPIGYSSPKDKLNESKRLKKARYIF